MENNSPEQMAIKLSKDKTLLLKRLKEAKKCLSKSLAHGFGKGKYEFENKRLIGDNGIVLQWYLRNNENEPIGYNNQQTTIGCVGTYFLNKGEIK